MKKLVFLLLILCILVIWWILKKHKDLREEIEGTLWKDKRLDKKRFEEEKIKDEIRKKLISLEKEFYPKFLAYVLYKKAMDLRISSAEIEEKIFREYGRILGMPNIDLTQIFSLKEYKFLKEELENFLISKEFSYIKKYSPSSNFEEYLLNKAKNEAENISKEIF